MRKYEKAIYIQYLEGASVTELSRKYNRTVEHVKLICEMGAYKEKEELASKELLPLLAETDASDAMQARLFNSLVRADICSKDSLVEKMPDILSGKINLYSIGSVGLDYLRELSSYLCADNANSESNGDTIPVNNNIVGSSFLDEHEYLPYGSLSFSIDSPSIGNAIQLIRDGATANVEISHQVRVYKKNLPQQGRYVIRIDIQEEEEAK